MVKFLFKPRLLQDLDQRSLKDPAGESNQRLVSHVPSAPCKARHVRVAPRRPPVCAACSRGPRWASATNADPSPAPSRGRVPCRGSACVRSPAQPHSAPCPRTRGGGGGGGGACGLWTGPGPCPGPGLCTAGHLIGRSGSGQCRGLRRQCYMEKLLRLRVVERLKGPMLCVFFLA